MPRFNTAVRVGQVWKLSDPRRLSAFKIVGQTETVTTIKPIYPAGPYRVVSRDRFQVTGSRGYTRIS